MLSATTSLRVLMVDDSLPNRKMLRRLLTNHYHDYDEAKHGQEAIDKFVAAADKLKPYDTILMDYEMPVMDGPTATKVLRALGCNCLIVGITGNVLPEDVAYFKSCGADAVLPKALKWSDLENLWVNSNVFELASTNSSRNNSRRSSIETGGENISRLQTGLQSFTGDEGQALVAHTSLQADVLNTYALDFPDGDGAFVTDPDECIGSEQQQQQQLHPREKPLCKTPSKSSNLHHLMTYNDGDDDGDDGDGGQGGGKDGRIDRQDTTNTVSYNSIRTRAIAIGFNNYNYKNNNNNKNNNKSQGKENEEEEEEEEAQPGNIAGATARTTTSTTTTQHKLYRAIGYGGLSVCEDIVEDGDDSHLNATSQTGVSWSVEDDLLSI